MGHDQSHVSNSGGDTPLHRAAYMGHLDIVKLLLEYQAQPNATNMDGQTALHRAAVQGKKEVRREPHDDWHSSLTRYTMDQGLGLPTRSRR